MPIDFPSTPTLNQTYTYNSRTWKWNGTGWQSVYQLSSTTIPTASLTKDVFDQASSYSTTATDAGDLIRSTSASAVNFTITNTLSVGQFIDFVQWGAGQVTFVAGSGVTLNASAGRVKTNVQYSGATVLCVASGVYWLYGDLT